MIVRSRLRCASATVLAALPTHPFTNPCSRTPPHAPPCAGVRAAQGGGGGAPGLARAGGPGGVGPGSAPQGEARA
jgi:hypothetical protein